MKLIGSKALKVHMHGYLMPLRLYKKLEHKSSYNKLAKYREELLTKRLYSMETMNVLQTAPMIYNLCQYLY